MTSHDIEAFAEIMTIINETFGDSNKPVSDIKMKFYFKALADLDISELNTAAIVLANTKTIKTFPTPAEIRNAVHGKPEDQAQIAWAKFLWAVRTHGGHATVVFDDPVIHAIVEREGGWIKVTEKTTDEMKWFGKDFLKIYAAYVPEMKRMSVPEKLVGIYEADNSGAFDDHVPLPVVVGDERKALGWTSAQKRLRSGTSGTVLSMVPGLMAKS